MDLKLPKGSWFQVSIIVPTLVAHQGKIVIDAHAHKSFDGIGDSIDQALEEAINKYTEQNK